MAIIGYHASHEQFKPSALLTYVQLAEKAGFEGALSSDHFHPWMTGIAGIEKRLEKAFIHASCTIFHVGDSELPSFQ